MTEDELEGRGCRHTAWGFLDVLRVLALPLYLYVEPWGRNLEKKSPQSRFGPQGKSPTRTLGTDANTAYKRLYRLRAVVLLIAVVLR